MRMEEGVVYREIGGKERKSSHDDDISDGYTQVTEIYVYI